MITKKPSNNILWYFKNILTIFHQFKTDIESRMKFIQLKSKIKSRQICCGQLRGQICERERIFFGQIQLGQSSPAIHGGAYFLAV